MTIYIKANDIYQLEEKHKENSIKILSAFNDLSKIFAVQIIIQTDNAERPLIINDSLDYSF